jgi:hypothetical protein
MRAEAIMLPDCRRCGLDPAHILSVCGLAASGGHDHPAQAVATAGGVRVQLGSRQAARDALAALARVGYQAVPMASRRHGRDLLVAEWSTPGLEWRLAAMRNVIYQLGADPATTAAAAIGQYRRAGAVPPARVVAAVLADARAQLRAWVSARSGIHAPHDPAILPADLGNALRLRAAWALEAAIDDLIERQLRVAGHAVPLFGSLRQYGSDDQAQEMALRRAGITFHLNGYPERDSSAQAEDAARLQCPDPPSRPGLGGRARAGQAPLAVAGFPTPVTGTAAARAAASSARPGGRHFPASRPGRNP